MAAKRKRKPESVGRASARPQTTTTARRHRPSSKAAETTETPSAVRVRKAAAKKTEAKAKAKSKAALRGSHEDKRESPEEMVTEARPKNLNGDTNEHPNKGKSSYALEAVAPGERPSRKSRRGGANHIKPDSQLQRQTVRAVRSPKSRQAMRGG